MWMVMYGVAALIGLVGLGCFAVVVAHAFRHSTAQGVLCLLVPFYVLYYAIVRFEHPRKGALVAGMVVAPLLAGYTFNAATAVFGPDVTAGEPDFEDDFPDDLGAELDDEPL
jgi:hypothetical protein